MRHFLLSIAIVLAVLAGILMSCRAAITRPAIFPAPKFRMNPELPGGELVTAHGSREDASRGQREPGTSVLSGERTAYGYYAKAGKKLIVFFHGNGEVMGSMQDVAGAMQREGFSVLMAEYPGYGYAGAYKASEANIYADALALMALMRTKYGHAAEDTLLWGFSLGTGVAVEMAAQKQGERLILMAPFTSAGDTAAHHFFFAARWLIVDNFDNKAKAPQIGYPVLIVHGTQDSVLPFRMGKELAGIFPRAEFMAIEGADHNDLFMHLGPERWQKIVRFAKDQ